LELTATPRSIGARSERFENVIFDYSLGQAMADGFVKEPAVATREDLRADSVTPEQLERIKLEDGIHCHENVKAELDIYARQSGRQKIHPFMLVVAQDTTHFPGSHFCGQTADTTRIRLTRRSRRFLRCASRSSSAATT
jgi:type III restriction enzyme